MAMAHDYPTRFQSLSKDRTVENLDICVQIIIYNHLETCSIYFGDGYNISDIGTVTFIHFEAASVVCFKLI